MAQAFKKECPRFFVHLVDIGPTLTAPRALSDCPPVIGPFHTSRRAPRGYRTTPHDPPQRSMLSYRTILFSPADPLLDEQEVIGPKDFLAICLHPRGLYRTILLERIGDSAGDRDDEHPQHNRDRSKLVFGRSDPIRVCYRGDRCYRVYQRGVRDAVSRLISDERDK